MAIIGYDRDTFGKKLNEVVSASRPILSIEHLIGRRNELDRIDKALLATGRSVFIFGERGVGKSSLAATAANLKQSSDSDYIDVSCAPDSTLNSVVASIASQALKRSRTETRTTIKKSGVTYKWLSYSLEQQSTPTDLSAEIKCVSDAIEVLKEICQLHSESPVVVVDEVDRITNEEELDKFADLLKQIGDKRVDLKFIFTGVGNTLDEILGSHRSAIRQLETIELPRLSWDARWDIAIEALANFGITISRDIYIRLAAVSDGYPYYVHLIVEKLLWLLFEKQDVVTEVTWDDYFAALDIAIVSISAELARPYDLATNQRPPDYELIVWSTSADQWQGAFLSNMYNRYKNIVSQVSNASPLSYSKYQSRLRNLLKAEYGTILVKGNRQGFYHYKEKILRGYIRMQAEANRVEIIGEEAKANVANYMAVPAKKFGYYRSGAPRGFR